MLDLKKINTGAFGGGKYGAIKMPTHVRCVSEVQRLIRSVFVFAYCLFFLYIRFLFSFTIFRRSQTRKTTQEIFLAIDLQQI